ncbi:hypothetical protein KAR91_53225 [Candidatus Pacearchaeota archaeon]|nr:hypothetical protein [Candidatus Pacearchaeota archaeon]
MNWRSLLIFIVALYFDAKGVKFTSEMKKEIENAIGYDLEMTTRAEDILPVVLDMAKEELSK